MPTWTEPENIKSPSVRALFDWWSSHRGPSGIPDRSDFDLHAHATLLSSIMIAEVEPEPFRIRYRLVGTRVAATIGTDFTNRYLDDLIGPDFTIPWVDYYRQVFTSRLPLMGQITEPAASGMMFEYEFGIFPVTVNMGTEVKQFVALEDYFDFNLTSGWAKGPWPGGNPAF